MGNTIKFLVEMRDGASGPLKKLGKAADESGKDAKTATTKYTELSSKLHLLGVAAGAAKTAVTMIAKPMILLGKESIGAGAQMEGFETRLNVLMGSSSMAKKRLDELFKIGSTTPFQLPGLIEAEVNLRALGVNAEETLPLIMDFAGAMKVDVARAAVEVGRAMQFGAGAVETIAGRSLRAQVELKTGGDALKMSTEEFKAALIDTLTDEQGIFKGGTDKLAATFDGMISNMQDAWFKFTKEIADAGLFLTAKATLIVILELLGKNQVATKNLATDVSGLLVESFFRVLDAVSGIIKLFINWKVLITSVALLVGKLKLLMLSTFEIGAKIGTQIRKIINLMPTTSPLQAALNVEDSAKADEALLKLQMKVTDVAMANADLHGSIVDLQDDYDKFGAGSEAVIESIREKTAQLIKENAAAQIGNGDSGGGKTPTPDALEKAAKKPDKGEKLPTAEEMEAAMRASLEGTAASLKELEHLLYLLSPAGLAEGMVDKLSKPMETMTAALGPAGGLVSGLSALGQTGSKAIVDGMKEAIRGVIDALVEVIPELIVEIPRMLMHLIPELIEGLVKAAPLIIKALLYDLPVAFANGLAKWWRKIWATIQKFFFPNKKKREERRERRDAKREEAKEEGGFSGARKFSETQSGPVGQLARLSRLIENMFRGKKHAGTSHIDRTGMALVQAGEQIVPSSGTTTQGMDRRMGRGGGTNVTINTNVVDSNAIRGLGKLLEREFGSFGRSTSPVFNSPTGTTG